MTRQLKFCLAWLGVLGFCLAQVPLTHAQSGPTFRVTVASAYLHSAPAMAAPRTFSVFQGQTYEILARTPDNAWLELAYVGTGGGTWIVASFGEVQGSLSGVPVSAGAGFADTGPTVTQAAPTPVPGGGGGGSGLPIGPVRAKLTITVPSTFVRQKPDWISLRIASLFQGAVVGVISRDAGANWVHLQGGGWVPSGVGTLDSSLLALPVETYVVVPVGAVTPAPFVQGQIPYWIPRPSPEMMQIYANTVNNGHDPKIYAIAGDCNSDHVILNDPIINGSYGSPADRRLLKNTWLYFRGAAYRRSVAMEGGFNTASVLDPIWSDPTQCFAGESPYACELRVTRASIVFILLGTGDTFQWQNFEGNYRRMIEYALSARVVPVVVTKADRLESQEGGAPDNYINGVIRKLAAEYQVPLLDFDLATSILWRHGLMPEGNHDFHLSSEGVSMHVLATLQTLYMFHP